MKTYSRAELGSALCCLRTFKQAYSEENGKVTIGDIRDLIDRIDLLEYCVKKQKDIPTDAERHFSFFGKMKWIKRCRSCKTIVNSIHGQFCPNCGQKFCS